MITQYYTKAISEEATKALHEVNFPFPIADMGFTVPQIVEMPVDYASVFDWLLEKGFHLSVGHISGTDNYHAIVTKDNAYKFTDHIPLLKTFDKAILLAVEFLKSEQNDA